jgi:hypothetical protein
VYGKQTYAQLAASYGCSIKTIQRRLGQIEVKSTVKYPTSAVILMDTTYFGRGFGVMVFRDAHTGINLHKLYVKYETNALYASGIEFIKSKGVEIKAIVCDGRKGLLQLYPDVPIQMCQFHQIAIVRRYLPRSARLQASKELWEHMLRLVDTDKESFIGGMTDWFIKWESYLNERKVGENGKSRYVHKRLRSAYRSVKTNLPWLFTWYDHMPLKIPHTTNAIDGSFSDLKNKIGNHNGLSLENKIKFIDEFLKV